MRIHKAAAPALFGAVTIANAMSGANATTFAPWEVANLTWADTLNVRKYPAGHSRKQASYPAGTILSMTGRCTGGVDLLELGRLSETEQMSVVRYRWCEIWHDPARDGNYTTGWVYGRYIKPN